MNKLIGIYSPAAQSGKSFAANVLAQHGFASLSFAEPIKRMGVEFLMSFGYPKDQAVRFVFADKEKFIPEIDCTPRHVLQTLGTDWGRKCIDERIWLTSMQTRIAKSLRSDAVGVVIDDVRFENEAKMIKDMKGEMWKIVRPSVVNRSTHVSEGQLDNWDGFDRVIENSGTIQQFRDQLNEIIAQG